MRDIRDCECHELRNMARVLQKERAELDLSFPLYGHEMRRYSQSVNRSNEIDCLLYIIRLQIIEKDCIGYEKSSNE